MINSACCCADADKSAMGWCWYKYSYLLTRLLAAVLRVKSKVEMFSKYERQKDKRSYDDRLQIFTGPQFVSPPERIKPQKVIRWNDEGLPVYTDDQEPSNDQSDAPAAVESVA